MKFATKVAALAVTVVAGFTVTLTGGAVANAAAPTQANVSTPRTWCEFPEVVQELPSVAKVDAEKNLSEGGLSKVLKCLEYKVVDKCDGTTVITAVNWAVSDNLKTRLTFEILGKDYTVIGGPDHKPVVVVCRPDATISPWLRYHATAIVHSFERAIRACQAL